MLKRCFSRIGIGIPLKARIAYKQTGNFLALDGPKRWGEAGRLDTAANEALEEDRSTFLEWIFC
jgi:hypothetical protein